MSADCRAVSHLAQSLKSLCSRYANRDRKRQTGKVDCVEKRHSRLGIASFSGSISVGVSMVLLLVIAGAMEVRTPGGLGPNDLETAAIGLFTIGLFLLDIIAFILGIAGLFQRERKKLLALLGVLISGLTMTVILGIIWLGLSAS